MYAISSPSDSLLSTLAILPPHWRLTVTGGNKRPLGYQWQKLPFSAQQLLTALSFRGQVDVLGKNGILYPVQPKGIGLLCGQTSKEFIFAVDCDGFSALNKLQELSRNSSLPPTVAFTSGKPGRAQYLFRLNGANHSLKSRYFPTAPGEKLEIRGEGLQSVLPPSPHPLTGQYHWLPSCRPDEVEVAIAPDWLLEFLNQTNPQKQRKSPITSQKTRIYPFPQPSKSNSPPDCNTSVAMARLLLEVIHPRFADEYHTWLYTGMALKFISDELLSEWDNWSQLSPKYMPGECTYKWEGFRGGGISDRYLHYLAYLS